MHIPSVRVVLIVLLLLFGIYRRAVRTLRPQPLRAGWLYLRIALYGVITLLVLGASLARPLTLLAGVAGLVLSAVVGFYALRGTKFERSGGTVHYTPHPFFGLAMLALFILRLVDRIYVATTLMGHLHTAPSVSLAGDPLASYASDPWTAALFLAYIGYYLYFYVGALLVARRHWSQS